jgi:D-alanyl-lipoteichoic acid acyltransferase DltB (MBOAT superfamily)
MLFSSLTFLFYFLPIFLIVYYLLPQQKAFRNVWFLIGSLVFYFWGEQAYILVLICSILGNYALGFGLDQLKAKPKKALLVCGLVFNLGLLIYFKYALLLTESLGSMLTIDWEGTNWGSHIFAIYLPLGISFFTFQGISYIIDVYRGEVKA